MNNELHGERSSQNRSVHIYESLCRYRQPSKTSQNIPLQPLQATQQQTQSKAADGKGYAQCPLYDTGTYGCGSRSQGIAETSFTQDQPDAIHVPLVAVDWIMIVHCTQA